MAYEGQDNVVINERIDKYLEIKRYATQNNKKSFTSIMINFLTYQKYTKNLHNIISFHQNMVLYILQRCNINDLDESLIQILYQNLYSLNNLKNFLNSDLRYDFGVSILTLYPVLSRSEGLAIFKTYLLPWLKSNGLQRSMLNNIKEKAPSIPFEDEFINLLK